jgi:hypothetical protein
MGDCARSTHERVAAAQVRLKVDLDVVARGEGGKRSPVGRPQLHLPDSVGDVDRRVHENLDHRQTPLLVYLP